MSKKPQVNGEIPLSELLSGVVQPFRTSLNSHRILAGIAAMVIGTGWILHDLVGSPGYNPGWMRLGLIILFISFLCYTYLVKQAEKVSHLFIQSLLVVLNIWILILNVSNDFRINYVLGLVVVYMISAASFHRIRNLVLYSILTGVFFIGGVLASSQPALEKFVYTGLILIVFIGVCILMYIRVYAQDRYLLRNEIFSSIFNDSDVGLFLLNPEQGFIEYVNEKVYNLFALPGNYFEARSVSINELLPVPVQSHSESQFYEIPIRTSAGRLFWGDIFVKNFRVSSAQFTLVRVVDVSSRKGAEETAERMAVQRKRLLEVSRSLLTTLDLNEIFNTIASALGTVVHYNLITLYWRETGSTILRPIAIRKNNWNEFNIEQFAIPEGKGIAGRVIQSDEFVVINYAHMDPNSYYPPKYVPNAEHLIAMPVRVNEENMGVFTVVRSEDTPFSSDDSELVQLLLSHSISAIKNSILFEEANRRTLHSRSLMEVTKAINSTMRQDQLLNLIVEKVLDLTHSKNGALFLLDEKTQILKIAASRGLSEEVVGRLEFKLGESIAGWVAQTGRGAMIHDVENHPKFRFVEQKEHFTSMISIPLKIKDRVVGILGVDRLSGEDYFTEKEFTIAQDFGEQASLAMENSRLFEQINVSERKYRSLFEEIEDAIFVATPEGRFLDINPAGIKMFGYDSKDEMLKINIWDDLYIDRHDRETFIRDVSRMGHVKNYEISLRKKDGTAITILDSSNIVKDNDGNVAYIHGIMKDVTEQRRFQQQLFQSQKMESIGQLAGGMAHDFNNILSGIMGYASFMKHQMDPENQFFRYVNAIENAANRAAELISQLLAFARGSQAHQVPLQLNQVIIDTLQIVDRTFQKSIELQTELDTDLPLVMGDPVQLQQVFLNLFVNARDAVKGKGTIRIHSSSRTIFANDEIPELIPGEYVIVSVQDNGIGMSPDIQKRIFEPFFTTKEVGKGTGLGLAMTYGVVKSHSGFIQVKSTPGEGSTFAIYIPAVHSDQLGLNGSEKESIHSVSIQSIQTKGAKILVVDDDPSIRGLISDILSHYGYEIIHASNGHEAIIKVDEFGEQLSLIILDIMMPRMNGVEGYYEIIRKYPSMRVIFSSGYSQSDLLGNIQESDKVKFLPKPYHVKELLGLVNSMTDGISDTE